MLKSTRAGQIMRVLEHLPVRKRNKVREVTMDIAANMIKAAQRCFGNASWVIYRRPCKETCL
ncbi:transposase [Mucilaginibacter psychrotolerans]|uniref:Transposase IS204/IS1001/IS1096/IS1165 DDE domain-containing protein n=1 Tax=Mucilaginibacter psychrotolerans TaxID=1524096 RepID=A0A4Y8SLU1_9SPHI|nr:transposase [Mucilaginibacter psychrotolerans]TFF39812.1 hypothetical protein E2R66_05470 [Mucilaginibacter psychrotolerans]